MMASTSSLSWAYAMVTHAQALSQASPAGVTRWRGMTCQRGGDVSEGLSNTSRASLPLTHHPVQIAPAAMS